MPSGFLIGKLFSVPGDVGIGIAGNLSELSLLSSCPAPDKSQPDV